MKFIVLLFLLITAFSPDAMAMVVCHNPIPASGQLAADMGSKSARLLDCPVEGIAGLGFSVTIDSSLIRSRGLILIQFEDAYGRMLWTWKSEPYIGQFTGLVFQKVIPVPVNAVRAKIFQLTEGERSDSAGEFRITVNTVGAGIAAQIMPKLLPVVIEGSATEWVFSTFSKSPAFPLQVMVRDIDGGDVYSGKFDIASSGTQILKIPALPIGYYTLVARANISGYMPLYLNKSFAVVGAGKILPDNRIGIDAALSWYGGTNSEVDKALTLIRLAGVGSIRDRLRWSQVQPIPEAAEWGSYKTVAEQVSKGGFQLVTVFHDSPSWTRGVSTEKSGDRLPPHDIQAVRRFGQIFARDMAGKIQAVEFWNEPNSMFFSGYPYQYANSIKAFYEGVKSVDSNMLVLSLIHIS